MSSGRERSPFDTGRREVRPDVMRPHASIGITGDVDGLRRTVPDAAA